MLIRKELSCMERHKDVLAYFNKEYVSTEIFPKRIGRKISQAKAIREDSDYDEEYEPSSETTALQIETAKELIEFRAFPKNI